MPRSKLPAGPAVPPMPSDSAIARLAAPSGNVSPSVDSDVDSDVDSSDTVLAPTTQPVRRRGAGPVRRMVGIRVDPVVWAAWSAFCARHDFHPGPSLEPAMELYMRWYALQEGERR